MIFASSVGTYLGNIKSASTVAVVAVAATALIIIVRTLDLSVKGKIAKEWEKFTLRVGRFVYRKETEYARDMEIGKLNDKQTKVRFYRFTNDLIIDLGFKKWGITPYLFMILLFAFGVIASLIISKFTFDSVVLSIAIYPLIIVGTLCVLYTKANLAHDLRIEAVIEAENVISNGIKDGVIVSVRNNLNLIPEVIRPDFRDFLDNVDYKNYHVRTALLLLNNNIGSISNDFIKKCIEFETQEEHGIVGMFSDIVELNNVKTKLRTDMKHDFEKVFSDFVIGSVMIITFLVAVILFSEIVANFYFRHPIGQIIILMDILLIIGEFVYITYLRANEI